MAKSGQYLNGRELLDCELDNLSTVDRLKSQLETHRKYDELFYREISKYLSDLCHNVKQTIRDYKQ